MPELAKVLIVDDEPDVLDLLERSLGLDYQVFRANGGSEGLELVWQHRFAVIITDQRMPDMSGVEFLERTIEYLPDTIRIILTGYTGVEDLIGAINAGRVYRYFTKPWEPRELEITVRRAVETYQLICERAQLLIELRHKVDDLAAALAREERVRAVFQKYVPAEVVNHVLAQEGEPGLIGERREVTVLFSDLRGFTSLVEQADPQWVVQEILTPYLGELGAVVMEHGGIIDKYLGDGLLAVFGAPLEHGDDPLRAVLAALEMRRRAEQ
ncbi:MAG: response regulator, partial [Deinococcus sp.]|nr:response regulator [Deinococcus sp.]